VCVDFKNHGQTSYWPGGYRDVNPPPHIPSSTSIFITTSILVRLSFLRMVMMSTPTKLRRKSSGHCSIVRFFYSTYTSPLVLWHMRTFFSFLLTVSIFSAVLASIRLMVTPKFSLSQQPFLFLGSIISSILGLVQCGKVNQPVCARHFAALAMKRLRRAMLCAPIVVTLFTMACLPTPGSITESTSSSDLALHLSGCRQIFNESESASKNRSYLSVSIGSSFEITFHGLWPLLCLCLAIHVFLSGQLRCRTRILLCTAIAFVHQLMVIITKYTSRLSRRQYLCPLDGPLRPYAWDDAGVVASWWDSTDVVFWRGVMVNLVAFALTNLIGWQLAKANNLERWRCLCVMLCSAARKSALTLTQKKLSLVSRSIVPPPLAGELERDFSTTACTWSSPLVIYLRNVSFLNAELVGFCTSNGSVAGSESQEAERLPNPAPAHVVSFTNQLLSQIKALSEANGCYVVHLRPNEILCVAGYPEVRVDHAHSCVQLALAIQRLISSISSSARVRLEARIAIHTGEAYAAVLGQSMLTFDLLGPDLVHLRRHLRGAAQSGRVLVSRATFDQLPEGYEGEIGPTVSGNGRQVHLETFFVQLCKSPDDTLEQASADRGDSRWPTLGESISTGSLAPCFARLARASANRGDGHTTNSEAGPLDAIFSPNGDKEVLISALRESVIRQLKTTDHRKDAGDEYGGDQVDACLTGQCNHGTAPPYSRSSWDVPDTMISRLERALLPPSFTEPLHLLVGLCHTIKTHPADFSWPTFCPPPPPHPSLEAADCPHCLITDSCERLVHSSATLDPTASTSCVGCPIYTNYDVMCPLADSLLWSSLFLRRAQLVSVQRAAVWTVCLLVLIGLAGGLLVSRISLALVIYPCIVIWCLLLLGVLSIRRLDTSVCLPVTLRQACVVFTLFLLLASFLFLLIFGRFDSPITTESLSTKTPALLLDFGSIWVRPPNLETASLLACLALLLALPVSLGTSSVTPLVSTAIVTALFAALHLTSAISRFAKLPYSSTNPGSLALWASTLPDAVFAHGVFIALVCLLPWQTGRLREWTIKWIQLLLERKAEVSKSRFALARLLENCVPRSHLLELLDAQSGSGSHQSSSCFHPQEHPRTGVIAVSVHGTSKGDELLDLQRSTARTTPMSVSSSVHDRRSTSAMTSSTLTASHRSRQATVVADCVRKLNRLICVVDRLAAGEISTGDKTVDNALKKLPPASTRLPLTKIYSVGNTVAYAFFDGDATDSVPQLGLFAQFLIQLFDEFNRQTLLHTSADENLSCRVEIGLHCGSSVTGIVDGPRFLVLHEILDYALQLASCCSTTTTNDRSLPAVVCASSEFVSRMGTSAADILLGMLPVGTDGSVFVWCPDSQKTAQLASSFVSPPPRHTVPSVRKRSKKLVSTSPEFAHPRSPPSAPGNSSASTTYSGLQPPPLPPHKRNYAIGEAPPARYQNHSPLTRPHIGRDRKLSSPLLPHQSDLTNRQWAHKSISCDVPLPPLKGGPVGWTNEESPSGDNVDRACFVMNPVEIVNGYAQPTTRMLTGRPNRSLSPESSHFVARAPPHCITNDPTRPAAAFNLDQSKTLDAFSGYANHVRQTTKSTSVERSPVPPPPPVPPIQVEPALSTNNNHSPAEAGGATASITSDDLFLAVERACERAEGSRSEGVTSLSSASNSSSLQMAPLSSRHHSNPLYTDNEYYDDDEDEVDAESHMPPSHDDGVPAGPLDAGVAWLQQVPLASTSHRQQQYMVGEVTESFMSNGSNFPNYRRPNTPPSITHGVARHTVYDPPLASTTPLTGSAGRRASEVPVSAVNQTTYRDFHDKDAASIDLLSTRVALSAGCEYEFEVGTTDFADDDDDTSRADVLLDGEDAATEATSNRPQSGVIPLLMESSWISSTDGGGGGGVGEAGGTSPKTSAKATEASKMSESLLVETGGALEDDFSELSSAAAGNPPISEAASSRNVLFGDPSDIEDDDGSFLENAYFPLTEDDQSDVRPPETRRLPDIAPVGLPNFGANQRSPPPPPPLQIQSTNHRSPPVVNGRHFLVDLTSPQKPTITAGEEIAEYDNLANAFSSPASTKLLPANHVSPRHRVLGAAKRVQGWRPRDPRHHLGSSKARGPRKHRAPYQRIPMSFFNADIVNEARRISQRFQAMGWKSALSIKEISSSSGENSLSKNCARDRLDDVAPTPSAVKTLLLFPRPRRGTRCGGGEYVNAHSLLRRLRDLDSGTVTTVTSHIDDDDDDDQMTDNGTFDRNLHVDEEQARLLISADLWLDSGRPRSLSNDCLTRVTGDLSSFENSSDEESHSPPRFHSHGCRKREGLARDLVLRRAANVRQLLPLELQPFVMPGCVSSLSPSTYVASFPRGWEDPTHHTGAALMTAPRRRRVQHHLVFVRDEDRPRRCSSDPQLLGAGAGTDLGVSLM
uniref:adenylate cyclase n=1 Tax=Mesocestoides corti TaxID=53468 RepID=A0A5K3FDV8_MESCO